MTTSEFAGRIRPVARRDLFREILAVLLLTLGSLVPVIPWLVGVALLWASDCWKPLEKVLGTLVWPFGYASVLLVGGFVPLESCGSSSVVQQNGRVGPTTTVCQGFSVPPAVGVGFLVVGVLAPLVVGAYLLVQAHKRVHAI
jgi:hypothetical protein